MAIQNGLTNPVHYLQAVISMTVGTVRGPATLRFRSKIWLEVDGDSVFCHGLRDMLQAVESTGSIKAAATHVGRSYRFVWARIKQAEESLGATLVKTQVGGRGSRRSELTDVARNLVVTFDDLRQRVFELANEAFERRIKPTLHQQTPSH